MGESDVHETDDCMCMCVCVCVCVAYLVLRLINVF